MKRIFAVLLAVVVSVAVLGCSSSKTGETSKGPEGELTKIIDDIYEKKPVDLELETSPVDLSDKDALKMYTGLDSADLISEAVASEPMMSAQAYSLVLVRVKDEKDLKTVAEQMKNGINTRKWICVEANDLAVAGAGDVVMLFMIDEEWKNEITSEDMVSAFKELCGGEVSVLLK